MQLRSLLFLSCLCVSCSVCRADSFVLSGSGVDDTFILPSSPSISAFGSYGFSINDVPVNENGTITRAQLTFFSQALGGGLLLESTSKPDTNGFGDQLYSGVNDRPTFTAGTFTLSGLETYQLNVTPTASTPEPGTFLLLCAGALMVAVRRGIAQA